MYGLLFYYIKLSYKVNSKIVKRTYSRSSSSFFALFLVVVEKFYQAQRSTFSHNFLIRIEPKPSYKIARKWSF